MSESENPLVEWAGAVKKIYDEPSTPEARGGDPEAPRTHRTDDLPGFLKMIREMVHERAPAGQMKQYLDEAIAELSPEPMKGCTCPRAADCPHHGYATPDMVDLDI